MDEIIKRSLDDVDKRPHQLFLTGDQIYADDIPSVLLPELTEVGRALLGVPEMLFLKNTPDGEVRKEANTKNFPATWRQELTAQLAKFCSANAANHVLSFGEYCALYLFFWSNVLWPENLKSKDQVFKEIKEKKRPEDYIDSLPDHLRDLYPEDERIEKCKPREDLKEDFDRKGGEVERVQEFYRALPKVRRALANIPSYMIFDDHEVTDDWYLTQDWRDKVLVSPLGVNVLRNALLSYTLFQAWGNDPKKFLVYPYDRVLTLAQELFPSGTSGPARFEAELIDFLFGFDGEDPLVKWHYTVSSGPAQTVVLDTRTRRLFPGRFSPPGLLSPAALEDQLPVSLVPSAGAEVLIVVSAAPVLGLALVEELAQPLLSRAGVDFIQGLKAVRRNKWPEITGYMEWDMEAWAMDPERFEALLARLQSMKRVVILSGDVHYTFSAAMDYWKKDTSTPSRIVQLTSSAVKNEWPKVGKRVLSTGTGQKILHNAFYPVERMGWENAVDLIDEIHLPEGKMIPATLRPLLNRSPVLLPTRGWPEGTNITRQEDWSWRMSLLKDERPDDDSPNARPKDGQTGAISPDVDPDSPEAGYLKVIQRHEKVLKNKIPRAVVYNSNIGVVTFSGTGDSLKVKHELMYQYPEEAKPDDPKPYTVHEASLAPATDSPPQIG